MVGTKKTGGGYRGTIDNALKRYLGTFTFEERTAGRAVKEMFCRICKKSIGWTDVVNYTDFLEVVCQSCKDEHGHEFAWKRARYLKETPT